MNWFSYQQTKLSEKQAELVEKLLLSILNGFDRVTKSKHLDQSDLTPHEVILKEGLLSVRKYFPLSDEEILIGGEKIPVHSEEHRIPVVLVPPLLAPPFLFDIFPQRSLVRYLLAKGFRVYLIDFGSPDKDHSHLSFVDYILDWMPLSLKKIAEDSGESDVSLFGYCMGGLFSLMYTALSSTNHVKNLITVASPIDMHQMGAAGRVFSLAYKPAHRVAKVLNFDLRKLDPQLLHLPGKLGTIGFHLTNPLGVLNSYWDLLLNLWDRDYVTAHQSMGRWINNLLDYPGATIQEIIVQMGLNNTLARKGEIHIGNQNAKLQNIKSSLLSFAGRGDKIVPIRSARKILAVVASEDKQFFTIHGGHVGVMVGGKVPQELWPISSSWLAQRSR